MWVQNGSPGGELESCRSCVLKVWGAVPYALQVPLNWVHMSTPDCLSGEVCSGRSRETLGHPCCPLEP